MDAPEYSANQGTPEALPQGEAKAINDLVEEVDLDIEEPVAFPEEDMAGLDEVPPMEGEYTGLDKLVFGASDRPDEPITAGASFGPGPMGTTGDGRTPDQKLKDMALFTLNSNQNLTPRSKSLMARIVRGD